MSATTAVSIGGRAKQKQGKGQKSSRQRRRPGNRTVPTNTSDAVTTSSRNGSSRMYHKQNDIYDGTGYECLFA